MTKDEALKMALEALCKIIPCDDVCDCTGQRAITAIKKALSQPEQEQEPVEYQMRTRPTWEVTSWSDWKKCSRDSAGDYAKTPKLHDWEYETRKLYTTPPKREWIGLTDVEWEAMYDKFAKYQEYGAFASGWDKFTRAIEAKLKELNHEVD